MIVETQVEIARSLGKTAGLLEGSGDYEKARPLRAMVTGIGRQLGQKAFDAFNEGFDEGWWFQADQREKLSRSSGMRIT
jgi:hypothetical protein